MTYNSRDKRLQSSMGTNQMSMSLTRRSGHGIHGHSPGPPKVNSAWASDNARHHIWEVHIWDLTPRI